eukprot:Plantae.Rhodophyta-Hildenbrandia_rubra.ctg5419.p1 GENE.Plantae.Rhodophyta-Hildenbrandia_rubra.ctg5419~~Plantae.Rhodophyta-Hildenbrandia_rubra.ctg5419.p1  ORF type:complete len:411 (-),score=91.66 Plantae.Rhodophyta-Hildenbrandia_rubra.ctg5419:767-1858(-)
MAFVPCSLHANAGFGQASSLCSSHVQYYYVSRRRRKRAHYAVRMSSSPSEDYYKLLEIEQSANPMAIKRAYRRLALKNHPDVSKEPDAKEKFMKIQEAYAVLSDPSKRKSYDRSKTRVGVDWGGVGFNDVGKAARDVEDYVRRWREKNPFPEDLDDNLGSIFNDFVSGVASTFGGSSSSTERKENKPSVLNDFVEFLEKQVGGFRGAASSPSNFSDDGLDEILQSGDATVLAAELEDGEFLLKQLSDRSEKLKLDVEKISARADEWKARSERNSTLDWYARDESAKKEKDMRNEAERLEKRREKVKNHMRNQEQRIAQISKRLEEVKKRKAEIDAEKEKSKAQNAKAEVDSELERMRSEMGLS